MPPLKILTTGDLHLGRYPSRIPRRRHWRIESVWDDLQQWAIDHDVHAVCLTGDIIDQGNAYFESFGPLRRGIDNLAEHGIHVFAVAGNHDFNVFPRLVESCSTDAFHFLGRGGNWESVEFNVDGQPRALVTGWSFPDGIYSASPLADFKRPTTDLPVIGLLHCDVDQRDSKYAPVSLNDLASAGPDLWLLGHIHTPTLLKEKSPSILYPGSLQPLDPGEPGAHGPWLCEIADDGSTSVQQVPLATIRYDRLDIDVSGKVDRDEVETWITEEINGRFHQLAESIPGEGRVVLRCSFGGRSRLREELESIASNIKESPDVSYGQMSGAVDKIDIKVRPDHDLNRLKLLGDPRGILAQVILQLEQADLDASRHDGESDAPRRDQGVQAQSNENRSESGEAKSQDSVAGIETLDIDGLLRNAVETMERNVFSGKRYQPLSRIDPDSDRPNEQLARTLLIEQCYRLLDECQRQLEV